MYPSLISSRMCGGVVLLLLGAGALAPAPATAPGSPAADQILNAMSAREVQLYRQLQELTPRVETYMQNLRPDATLGEVPVADRYYLGILDFSGGRFRTVSFLSQPRQRWRQMIGPLDDLLISPARHTLQLDIFHNTFAGMLFPGADRFDRRHYRFQYVRREFLGQVRCYVFDVAPLDVHAKGAFWGRIWIEDHRDTLVRFNGSFWEDRFGHPDLHFDSWRWNVRPGVWMPAYIYSEESDLGYGMFRHARYQAQTRIWGYDLSHAGNQQELTTLSVEGAELTAKAAPPEILSPLESERAWERQAEDNVLDRLESAGLLAPPGPADAVLQTVANNLIFSNHLAIAPAVRCRILLTTPLESLTIGHTIVLSRGLVDSLPDEASLAAMLAHELAHVSLGQRLDTRYAFGDRMLFADQDALHLLDLKRTPQEEAQANQLAVALLVNSPYKDQLASAGLFLRQVEERRKLSPHLFNPNLGNGWFSRSFLVRLRAVETKAPALQPAQASQIAALPLGGRLLVDPWDGSVTLQTQPAVHLLSSREKMPLQVTPFMPYLERAPAPTAKASPSAGSGRR